MKIIQKYIGFGKTVCESRYKVIILGVLSNYMQRRNLTNRFVKNTFWILGGQIFRLIISFIISSLTARYLGPSNNGIINYVTSYISFFTSIVGLGLNGVIIHELVNHRDEEGKILGTAIILRCVVGIISFFGFIALVYIIDGKDQIIMQVAFLQALQLPFLCLDTIMYWYQSNMQSKYSVVIQLVAYTVMAFYKVYLLIVGKEVVWFAFAVSFDIIILGFLYLVMYHRHKKQKFCFTRGIAKRLFMNGLPFVLANIMVVIYGQMDKIMIKQLMDSTKEVGIYSATINICGLIGFIPVALLDSARPLIAEAKNESEEKYKLRFRQLVAGIMWLCIIYSLFVMIFSKLIINLIYGKAYMGANVCLKIAVWYTTFSYLGSAKSFWLICENKKKYVFIFSVIGAICNVSMNLMFIPIWGINGAAVATLITQILVNFIIPIMFKETREYGKCVLDALLLRNIQLKEIIKLCKN